MPFLIHFINNLLLYLKVSFLITSGCEKGAQLSDQVSLCTDREITQQLDCSTIRRLRNWRCADSYSIHLACEIFLRKELERGPSGVYWLLNKIVQQYDDAPQWELQFRKNCLLRETPAYQNRRIFWKVSNGLWLWLHTNMCFTRLQDYTNTQVHTDVLHIISKCNTGHMQMYYR